jgi:hypothetical protein
VASPSLPLSAYFEGRPEARAIFDRLHDTIQAIGGVSMRTSKSQVAFRRKRTFAAAWIPDRYLRGHHAPLVLTLYFRHRERSGRWKEVVEAAPGRFTHHLELRTPNDVDDEVRRLARRAWEEAG